MLYPPAMVIGRQANENKSISYCVEKKKGKNHSIRLKHSQGHNDRVKRFPNTRGDEIEL